MGKNRKRKPIGRKTPRQSAPPTESPQQSEKNLPETTLPSDTGVDSGFISRLTKAWNQIKRGNLVHITLAYLALPMLIFLFGWLKLIYALPLAALLVFLLVQWGGEIKANVRPNRKALVICGIVALLWTATSGAGGFGYQNWDYEKHNAIFKMLIFSEWPALFDADRTLVYTIGYHLPAAAFGKVFGWTAANVALFIWTLTGAYLTLLWFVRFVRGRVKWLAPLFVILSGMDIIIWNIYHPQSPPLGQHIEFAAGMQYFQFSSMSTLLYWVPQHGLPGWLGAALFMQLKDEAGFYRHSMLLGACIFLWSFFPALGLALLIIAWFALMPQYIRAAVLPPSNLLQQAGGALLLLTVFLYISSNNLSMGYEFFAKTLTETGQWPRYAAFLVFEFALVGICALLLIPRGHRGLLVALLVILAALPLYKVGILNDIAMRTSIPVLFVFWCVVLDSLSNSRSNIFTAGTLKGLILFAILVGAVTPGMEIYRSLANYRISPPRLEGVKDVDKVWNSRLTALYIGHRHSFFFRNLAQDTTGKIGIGDEK